MSLSANGSDRAAVDINQPVNFSAKLEMPPGTGQIVRYNWTIADADKAVTVIEKPQETGKVDQYSTAWPWATPMRRW